MGQAPSHPDGGAALRARRTGFGRDGRVPLLLRSPDLGRAARIAERVNELIGPGTATVEDPGSVALSLPREGLAEALVRIGEIPLVPDRPAQILIGGRNGLVVSGGDLLVGPAGVSHGTLTLSIGEGEPSGAVGGG